MPCARAADKVTGKTPARRLCVLWRAMWQLHEAISGWLSFPGAQGLVSIGRLAFVIPAFWPGSRSAPLSGSQLGACRLGGILPSHLHLLKATFPPPRCTRKDFSRALQNKLLVLKGFGESL